jgi:hypothetical protein
VRGVAKFGLVAAPMALWLAAGAGLLAGPLEFGLAEVRRAIEERRLNPKLFQIRTEISTADPETYRIAGRLVSGGDLRGLMYGLLAAAEQIRNDGFLVAASGKPAVPIRGIRRFLHNRDLEQDWYYSRDYWLEYLRMLARNRFNRFNLVFAHQTEYLAPPYPYWVEVKEFPEIRVPGLTAEQRARNLDTLCYIAQTAADHGIDFTLGIWQHNVQRGMKPSVEGLTGQNIGPYSYAALKQVLAACPAIRSVQVRTNSESGIPPDQQVEFFRDYVYRAVREAGRRVTLDLRGWLMSDGMLEAATGAGVPLRLSSKFWAEHMGRPYPPAETFPNYSYLNFLRKPRPYEFFWEIWALGSNRLLLWGDPEHVRRTAGVLTVSGTQGFEIDEPLAQKGFGNRPGKWGVFTESHADRVFWKHEFERYWFFYLLWGRLTYDPKTPERVWRKELERRFGSAAPEVLEAYQHASRILPELSAVHMPDPNMYVWPEINPGGLIEVYKDVLPSDWRLVASIPEAVRNRLGRAASAKQTPQETAERFERFAAAVEQALARADARLGQSHREWRGTAPDFRVLAALARYHAHKQRAAEQLAYFYEAGDPAGLEAARAELEAALRVWEGLVKLTDGLYPDQMAFGPADTGHWKDKLPYVRHDLATIEERRSLWNRFGRFLAGFDFGAAVPARQGAIYRTLPSLLHSTVEPRFRPVSPETEFDPARGFGWTASGRRAAGGIGQTPYEILRATAREAGQLPENLLFGDWIEGEGPQTFRVRVDQEPTSSGGAEQEYTVTLLFPDGNATSAVQRASGGVVDIVFPEGRWQVAGVIVKSTGPELTPRPLSRVEKAPRPLFSHLPAKQAQAGRPLSLRLGVSPPGRAHTVRLHYRAMNQLAPFRILEAPAGRAAFTIPGEEIDGRYDLMYYFEALDAQGAGWFYPDPADATPYFVVEVR